MDQFPYSTREYDIYPYDPAWAGRFSVIAKNLREIFGKDTLDIQHIGSTSVPGMEAKPTIDVLVVIPKENDLDAHKQEMEKYYVYEGQKVRQDSRLYREVNDGEILANIHIFPEGHTHISDMILLRDYLRTHAADVEEYSRLKKDLREKYPNNYAEYRKQKDEYMNGTLKKRAGITNQE
jgi:GrpB-like predicted nucleotidyltransferase (UPF0157 family)